MHTYVHTVNHRSIYCSIHGRIILATSAQGKKRKKRGGGGEERREGIVTSKASPTAKILERELH